MVEIVRRNIRRRRRNRRRRLVLERPVLNLEYNNVDFFQRYRFKQETVYFLTGILGAALSYQTLRNSPLPPFLQICICLRYLAGSGIQLIVADSLDVSKSTVCRTIWRVVELLTAPRFLNAVIHFPRNRRQLDKIKQGFHELAKFPNVVGCVDGTFIPIQKPAAHTHEYINRKGFASLNVQMICDHRFMITNLVAKWPGSAHDSRVFRNSRVGREFDNGTNNGILLGDSAYPCKHYILPPYINPAAQHERQYNRAHCRTRVVIEQTFGLLKRRFAILKHAMQLTPPKACKVTSACSVLHNIGIIRNDILPTDDDFEYESDDHFDDDELANLNTGLHVRDHIAQTLFG